MRDEDRSRGADDSQGVRDRGAVVAGGRGDDAAAVSGKLPPVADPVSSYDSAPIAWIQTCCLIPRQIASTGPTVDSVLHRTFSGPSAFFLLSAGA